MKISQRLWIDSGIHFHAFKRRQLEVKNKYKGKDYLICTGSRKEWLFEIFTADELTQRYDQCYLLALTKDKETAKQYVAYLLDCIYNQKNITYESLKR